MIKNPEPSKQLRIFVSGAEPSTMDFNWQETSGLFALMELPKMLLESMPSSVRTIARVTNSMEGCEPDQYVRKSHLDIMPTKERQLLCRNNLLRYQGRL